MGKTEKRLDYRKAFLNALYKASEYDAVALCFREIRQCLGETISKNYVSEEMSRLRRRGHIAYAGTIEGANNKLLLLAQKKDEENAGFEGFLFEAISLLRTLPLEECIQLNTLRAIGLFFLLHALDQYILSSVQSMKAFGEMQFGPLNHNENTGYIVYPRECSSIFSNSYKKSENEFRMPITSTELGSLFKAFFVVKAEHFSGGIPKIIPVKQPLNTQEKPSKNKEIIIASIPFIGFRTIQFHNLKDDTPLAENEYPSGSFYVEHLEDREPSAIRLVTELLVKAIDSHAEIIVFPEYIMSKQMLEAIKAKLSELTPLELKLVFAGTTYEFDEEKLRGNNVMHILNGRGIEIGKYYKSTPFNNEADKPHHATTISDDRTGEWPFSCIELLSDPGKECLLLDVEKWGRILPSVCRDFIDGDYTDQLVKTFCPSFVVIPAWSHSVSSFDSNMNSYANTIHTMSLLCNSCNAVNQRGEDDMPIASICMPRKVNRAMEARLEKQTRKADCRKTCEDCGGCIVFYHIDFSKQQPDFHVEMKKSK